MITLLIKSKAHGPKEVLLDPDDLELISGRNWCLSGNGKYCISGNGEYMHRVITKAKQGEIVDHINLDTFDNRRINLRITDSNGNATNKSKRSTPCTSRYKGVTFDKSRGKWMAYINSKGKRINLGRFTNERDAAMAYNRATEEIHGEMGRTNEGID